MTLTATRLAAVWCMPRPRLRRSTHSSCPRVLRPSLCLILGVSAGHEGGGGATGAEGGNRESVEAVDKGHDVVVGPRCVDVWTVHRQEHAHWQEFRAAINA